MSGILGSIEGTSGSWKTLYKPGAGEIVAVLLCVGNRAASVRNIKAAVFQDASADVTPTKGFVVPSVQLTAAGDATARDMFQYSGIVLNGDNNDQLLVHVDGDDVDFIAMGVA